MKKQISRIFMMMFLVAVLPSCGGSAKKALSPKQYAKMRYSYDHIRHEYEAELTLSESADVSAIRRCVLGHADETRRRLGGSSVISGKYQRYVSYPFLEYAADLRATISDLERMSGQLNSTTSSDLMRQLSREMRETASRLCSFKTAVIADTRYLREQDKWDEAQQVKNQQSMVNLLVANSMAPQKILHEVRIGGMK